MKILNLSKQKFYFYDFSNMASHKKNMLSHVAEHIKNNLES